MLYSSSRDTMRALVYRDFGGPISVEELPRPSAPADGVVIEVKAVGVCRSDWHGWRGHDGDIIAHGLPFVPGHEVCGLIAELGESVKGTSTFAVGDRVAVPFILSCGHCRECGRCRPTICENQEQPGFTMAGGFAEFLALPRAERNLCKLPDGVSYVEGAALGCRFTTAFRATIQQGRLQAGETLAVFGCGGLGLAAVMIGAAHGAQVIAVDSSAAALSKARDVGAAHALDASALGEEELRSRVMELAGGVGADVALDAAGVAPTCQNEVWCARRGGRMVQAGLPLGDEAPLLPMGRVAAREVEIIGSHGIGAPDLPTVLAMVAEGKLQPARLVEREVSLEEGGRAIECMDHGSSVGITMVTRFR